MRSKREIPPTRRVHRAGPSGPPAVAANRDASAAALVVTVVALSVMVWAFSIPLVRAYGLADSVLLDLGEVRGFDYYSGVHFEAYVTGLGAPLVGGGRYDQMLARFGYDCPATGFAFETGRALLAMESQGAEPRLAGPDFFVIDFTAAISSHRSHDFEFSL